jgi:hypothetical protein
MKESQPRSNTRLLRACAWCERIQLDEWIPPETAIARLRTFEWPHPPTFTHGICDDCLRVVLGAREAQRAAPRSHAA